MEPRGRGEAQRDAEGRRGAQRRRVRHGGWETSPPSPFKPTGRITRVAGQNHGPRHAHRRGSADRPRVIGAGPGPEAANTLAMCVHVMLAANAARPDPCPGAGPKGPHVRDGIAGCMGGRCTSTGGLMKGDRGGGQTGGRGGRMGKGGCRPSTGVWGQAGTATQAPLPGGRGAAGGRDMSGLCLTRAFCSWVARCHVSTGHYDMTSAHVADSKVKHSAKPSRGTRGAGSLQNSVLRSPPVRRRGTANTNGGAATSVAAPWPARRPNLPSRCPSSTRPRQTSCGRQHPARVRRSRRPETRPARLLAAGRRLRASRPRGGPRARARAAASCRWLPARAVVAARSGVAGRQHTRRRAESWHGSVGTCISPQKLQL